MRPICWRSLFGSILLFAIILTFGIGSSYAVGECLLWGDFRGIALVSTFIASTFLFAILINRIFLLLCPIGDGPILASTPQEFAAQVNMLFYLLLFFPVLRSQILPVPIVTFIYCALGTIRGANSYIGGVLLDPPLTSIGKDSIVGHGAVIYCHVIEGQHFAYSSVQIGNNVTIGAMAVVLPGVVIEDGAIVAAGAVVKKDARILAGEIWGGVPARPIGKNRHIIV